MFCQKDGDIAMVFQNYALYPHKNVADNMGFSLKIKGRPKAEIDAKVKKAAEILDLGKLLDRFPKQLWGGQRERVAMDAPSCATRKSSCSMSPY